MKGNFVAKHMRTFNHGGAHKNKKDLYEDFDDLDSQLELSEYRELTEYKLDEENWGNKIPPIHFYSLTFLSYSI